MAAFPITGRFVGDFVPHLVAVDTEDTLDEVAAKVAVHSVGRRVARPATEPGYEVLLDGRVLDPAATFGQVIVEHQILPLQWIDVRFRESKLPTAEPGAVHA
ncbi:toluene monooxygenase system protein B [Parafrankia irregularis]|uniref:Toluene monooxygenase system protein B n=1 Tax=Parafrankia irregularis TaxID=795642 RepID=A0A0S4QQK4_9ACTN|nr:MULTISPECIES: toluene-4-monooxygenase system B family protein [Parafrankia]MBE3201666.1 toluene-4-monooxygenase system B family protein [Parafrankia sp. CH37]CUU57407.1 toluene monooxygenase system protein B [Parafrankia irregularis]